jgi:hypothetical protein
MTPRAKAAPVLSGQSCGWSGVAGRSPGSSALPTALLPALPCHHRSFQSLVTPPVARQCSQLA